MIGKKEVVTLNYKDYIDLFGTKVKLIPNITGKGAPTSSTEGAVGCLYMDTNNGNLYKCTAVTNGVHRWVAVAEGGGGSGGGGASTMTVLVEDGIADKSASDIYSHVSNGGGVSLHYNNSYYTLLCSEETCAWFGYLDDEGFGHVISVVDQNVEKHDFDYVTMAYFDEVVGNISTALDHIIAIQEELIGR